MLVHQQTSVLWYIGPFQYTALTSVFMMSPLFLLPPSHHVPPSRHTALPLSLCSDCFIHNHVCSQLRRSAVHLQFVVHVRCIYAAIFRWVHCIGLLLNHVFVFVWQNLTSESVPLLFCLFQLLCSQTLAGMEALVKGQPGSQTIGYRAVDSISVPHCR